MLQFAESLARITSGRSAADLESDERLRWSVERLLEMLGEASRRVGVSTRSRHPEIPWRNMADMRNRLIHVYDEIDYAVVWNTVETDVVPLIEALRRILR